ncbi:MAG: glycerophosphodiester phosphodiesterase [Clostridiales bacterium]|nr:glycerophosphodiester phosphodiesterase [Clostridiales bacterium]
MNCLNVAHAGFEGLKANSIESVWAAAKMPFDVLEVDVRKDGRKLYLSHEFRGNSEECADLKDVLEWVLREAPEKKIGLDLKEPVFDETMELIREFNMGKNIIFSGSLFLKDLQKDRAGSCIFYNVENSLPEMESLSEVAKAATSYGADGLNMDYRMLNEKNIEEIKTFGILAAVWTVDDKDDMERMLKAGADSITTRYPLKLAELINAERDKSEICI